jgi:peptidoglycan/xylan/chitin deacetylase (PgdA/CDA1 family)
MPRAILTYHSIDGSGSVVSTTEAVLARQIAGLATRSVDVVDPVAILDRSGETGNQDVVAITFDDGFANFYTRAFPILARHELSATVLLVAGLCGGTSAWARQPATFRDRELLTWSKIQELQTAGIQFGAHSVDHPSLPLLPIDAARGQILDSKQLIEDRTGTAVECFAYPYGEYSPAIAEIIAENFAVGLSTEMGFLSHLSRPEALERIDAYYLRQPFWFDRMFQASGHSYLACRATARILKQRLSGLAATQNPKSTAR